MADPVRFSSLDALAFTCDASAARVVDGTLSITLGAAVASVGPGGYVLTSDGTSWVAAPAPGGTVPAAGAAGNFLISDGVGWTTQPPVIGDIGGLSAALALKAPITSPLFLGEPRGPTAPPLTNDNGLSTNEYVDSAVAVEAGARAAADALLAPIDSPALTGTGTSTTPPALSNNGRIATAAYADAAVAVEAGLRAAAVAAEAGARAAADALLAPLASPTFSGNVLVPTAPPGTNDQRAASTAFVAAALALLQAGRVVRTTADLPTPVGGVYTLEPGVTVVVGDVPLGPGQPPALVMAPGEQIKVPDGATLAAVSSRGAVIFGIHPAALVDCAGGDVVDLILLNVHGGVGAADVAHTAGANATLRGLICVGSGDGQVVLRASGAQLGLEGIQAVSLGPTALRGFVLDAAALYFGFTIVNCYALNNASSSGHVGFDVESGAQVSEGISLTGCTFIGGFNPLTATNCIGVRYNVGATIAQWAVTGTTFAKYTGAGSVPLDGISTDTTTAIFGSCFGVANTAPKGAIELDATAGVAPQTNIGAINTWYPVAATGATTSPDASLFDSPNAGELRALWAISPTQVNILAVYGVERVGGGSTRIKTRVTKSTDGGVTWTQVGIAVGSVEATTTTGQCTLTVDVNLNENDRIRLEVLAIDTIATLSTRTLQVSAR